MTARAPVWVYASESGGREMTVRCLNHYAAAHGLPPCGGIVAQPGRKPAAAGGRLHFSVSHSGLVWACAVHTAPVGLDVERIRPGRPEAAIARRWFSAGEQAFLAASPGRFYPLWCAKEAWVKYTGAGIARGFGRCSLVRGGRIARWRGGARLASLSLAPGYVACLWHTAGFTKNLKILGDLGNKDKTSPE